PESKQLCAAWSKKSWNTPCRSRVFGGEVPGRGETHLCPSASNNPIASVYPCGHDCREGTEAKSACTYSYGAGVLLFWPVNGKTNRSYSGISAQSNRPIGRMEIRRSRHYNGISAQSNSATT